MIAYDKKLLENTFLVAEAVDMKKSGFLSKEDLDRIKTQLPGLKTNRNIFVRIGFLLLGALLYLSIIGVIALIAFNRSSDFRMIGFLISIIGFAILEMFCRQNYFRHGLDDAFIIGAQLTFYASVVADSDSPIGLFIAMIFLGFIFAIRYVSILSFIVSVSGVVLFIGFSIIEYTILASILPFVLLLLAVGFYMIYRKVKDKPEYYLYQDILYWFQIFSLVLGYASVNYFVVRSLSEEYLGFDYTQEDIPFGWFFYVLMFAVPIAYIYFSLKLKNRTMLYIGGLSFGISILTFRYYHSILPAEWALLLSGIGIFAAVYFIIQKIKTNATRITFQHDRTNNTAALNNIEALLVNSQDIKHAEDSQDSSMPFGGGGYSGGGAGENF